MGDWSPLAESDPVPGDPGGVAVLAGRLRSTAADVGVQRERLLAVRAEEFWEGEAARVFVSHQRELPPKLAAVVRRCRGVADGLDGYHPRLAEAQAMARRALAQAREAEAHARVAERGVAEMEAHRGAAVAAADAWNAAHPGGPPHEPVPWSGPDWHARLLEAADRLDAARGMLMAATDLRDEAARACSRAIGRVVDDGQVSHTLWGQFGHVAGGLWSVADRLMLAPHLVRPAGDLARGVARVVSYEIRHPAEALKLAVDTGMMVAGEGLAVVGGGGEGLGVALDVTGVGAAVGVPVNVASAAAITAGVGTAAVFAHRVGDDLRHAADAAGRAPDSEGSLSGGLPKPDVSDVKLRNLVDKLYRDNAQVGTGSTADALRNEQLTRQPTAGRWHFIKSKEMVNALSRWIRSNPDAAPGDRAAANAIRADLVDALRGGDPSR